MLKTIVKTKAKQKRRQPIMLGNSAIGGLSIVVNPTKSVVKQAIRHHSNRQPQAKRGFRQGMKLAGKLF